MVRRTIHAIQINTKSYHRLYEHFSIYFLCFFAIFLSFTRYYKDFLKQNQNLTLQYVDHSYTACSDNDIIVTGFHCDAWYSLVNVVISSNLFSSASSRLRLGTPFYISNPSWSALRVAGSFASATQRQARLARCLPFSLFSRSPHPICIVYCVHLKRMKFN